MNNLNKGQLIVFSGPSGVGKGSILAPFLESHKDVKLSVSATTRAPRPGEVNGVHYFFLTREEFEERIRAGRMLEYAQYNGNYYGTPKDAVEEQLAAGNDVILEIEVQGAKQVCEKIPGAVSVFVMPPSFEELRSRLTGRQTESAEVIEGRLAIAKKEMALAGDYDYIVLNDTIPQAAARMDAILLAAKCTAAYMKDFIDEVNDHE